MANFAELENNIVVRVIAIADADCAGGLLPEADITGKALIQSLGLAGVWMLTDMTGSQRYNYAGIGYTYDAVRDAFIAPKPFPSWVLDENVMRWFAPVPMPSEGGPWTWDEATLSWIGTAYPVVFMKPR